MTMIALVGAKGSPGVTVTGLALTFAWPQPVLLAEADPAGGDIRHGYLRRQDVPGDIGLMQVAIAEMRGNAAEQLWHNVVDLQEGRNTRVLLPGLAHPGQAATVEPVWDGLARLWRSLPSHDVIVDCGRLSTPFAPWPVLWHADAVLVVARPTAASLASARHTLHTIRAQLRAQGTERSLGMLITGDGDYKPREIEREFSVDGYTPEIVATIAGDRRSAKVLSFGGNLYKRRLLRTATKAAVTIRNRAAEVAELLRGGNVLAEASHD